jgi:hypothetical protein
MQLMTYPEQQMDLLKAFRLNMTIEPKDVIVKLILDCRA